jgi:hypothetical protein
MVSPLWATIQHDQPVIYRFLIIINIAQRPSRIRLRQKRIRATPLPGMKQSWRLSVWAQRGVSPGAAPASGAFGYLGLRFAISASLFALQSPRWFPHHHL